ncbi:glass bottom boat2 [Tribolium castaneum]|uniref:Glass bottom boat2 n=1 Tax=Tribolium castaneum TaxID=7070 RepID=D6WJG4_TRICA|nr:glass bottom boat2 [Tribolium castaneum]
MKVVVASFVLLLVFREVSTFLKSGIYLDNGFDQTSIGQLGDQQIQLEVLNLLGLPNRPKKINNSVTKSAAKYILDIYNSLMEKIDGHSSRRKRSAGVNLSSEEETAVENSDVIMTFEAIRNSEKKFKRLEKGKKLWFNVSEMSVAEDGRECLRSRRYELVDRGRRFQYVSSVNTTGNYKGWLSLNLTSCTTNWSAHRHYTKGFYLSVYPVEKPGREIRPEEIGLTTSTNPFIVAFLKASTRVQPQRNVRSVSPKQNYVSTMKQYQHGTTCRIHTLYISFKDLKWQDWVIAPEGYAAYYCAGECNFPLTAHMNATKHALVQSLVHLIQPHKFPKPCCAPTELRPIPLVYYLDAGTSNVVLKKYSNMAVKSCGCH